MRTYAAAQVADFYRASSNPELGDFLSNLKLQKLCYYAAGISAAVRANDQAPLFGESLEAWLHGPVVPDQYFRFRGCGAEAIPQIADFDFNVFDEADSDIMNDVYRYYGQYSAWKLRDMTHEEKPWIDAYNRADKRIKTAELREFFYDEVSSEYIESYLAKQGQQETV